MMLVETNECQRCEHNKYVMERYKHVLFHTFSAMQYALLNERARACTRTWNATEFPSY